MENRSDGSTRRIIQNSERSTRSKPEYPGSQSYSDLTYDGENLWAAWKSYNYKAGLSKINLLLKIDKETGEILTELPVPFGEPGDGDRGLAWDGTHLWYACCGGELRSIDKKGTVTALYKLPGLERITGLAHDGTSLWIIEFDGKLWNLPLADPPPILPALPETSFRLHD
jgi:hypothetical protein